MQMLEIAKKMISRISILILGALTGMALLVWYLNHSQCVGLTWSGIVGSPAFARIDPGNCIKIHRAQVYEGVWQAGFGAGNFYPIDSSSGEYVPLADPIILFVDHPTHDLVREKLNLDDDIRVHQNYRIKFWGNLLTNYHKGRSLYPNHIALIEIKNIEVFDGELPRNR